jgi:hypothetical protein
VSEQCEPVCTGGMSEAVAEAGWAAIKRRQQQMLDRLKDPAADLPVECRTYRADAPPAGNPKDVVASERIPMDLWPPAATAMGVIAMLNGSLKYGRANWRKIPVRATVYVGAAQRHLAAWIDGEDADEDGVPHLSSVLASLAIVVDALAAETLIDDRPTPGGYRRLATELTPHVARLRAVHAVRPAEPA